MKIPLRLLHQAHIERYHLRVAQRWRKQFYQRLYNPTRKSHPVFLVGSGRSGTNMLASSLSRSWNINLFNEDNPQAFEHWRLRDLSIIESLVEHNYAPIVLFKPILDTYRIGQFLAYFTNAKAIFIFRQVDDVVNSSLKKFGTEDRIGHVNDWIVNDFQEFSMAMPPQSTRELIRGLWKPNLSPGSGAALYWLFQNSLFFDLNLSRNKEVALVQYEAVVTSPTHEFRKICEFLDIKYAPKFSKNIFASSIKRDNVPEIDSEIRDACDLLFGQLCSFAEMT